MKRFLLPIKTHRVEFKTRSAPTFRARVIMHSGDCFFYHAKKRLKKKIEWYAVDKSSRDKRKMELFPLPRICRDLRLTDMTPMVGSYRVKGSYKTSEMIRTRLLKDITLFTLPTRTGRQQILDASKLT